MEKDDISQQSPHASTPKQFLKRKNTIVTEVRPMPELVEEFTRFGNRRSMKLPKYIAISPGSCLSVEEKVIIAKTVADAKGKDYELRETEVLDRRELHSEIKMKYDASELSVITKAKILTSYIMTVTAKSPVKFRFTFVSRMQNYCLDILECLVSANSLRKTNPHNKQKRKDLQHEAYSKYQLLSYISFVAYENACLTKKQYERVAIQISECVNLLVAWTKSDAK